MPAELTINEAAHLAGVSTKLIEKSVESGILHAEKVTDVLTRRLTRRLPLAAASSWSLFAKPLLIVFTLILISSG